MFWPSGRVLDLTTGGDIEELSGLAKGSGVFEFAFGDAGSVIFTRDWRWDAREKGIDLIHFDSRTRQEKRLLAWRATYDKVEKVLASDGQSVIMAAQESGDGGKSYEFTIRRMIRF